MWQGDSKTKSNATSILDALKNLNQQVSLIFYIVLNGISRL